MKPIKRFFSKTILKIENMSKNPMKQFNNLYKIAKKTESTNINRMVLSTTYNNKPYARWINLLELDNKKTKLSFFTDYKSRKSQHIDKNNNVSMLFYWPKMNLEIKINGEAKKFIEKENEDYYNSLPEMDYYTIVSKGTKKIGEDNRTFEFREETEVFTNLDTEGKKMKLPENWGGYEIILDTVEFCVGYGMLEEKVFFMSWLKEIGRLRNCKFI